MAKYKPFYILLLIFSGLTWPSVGQSIFDAQSINFYESSKVELNGEWSFYRSQLLGPGDFDDTGTIVSPGSWTTYKFSNHSPMSSFGYGTYRIKIVLPRDIPHMALFIPDLYSSSKVWIDGELRSEIGRVASDASEVVHKRLPETISFNTDKDTLEIVIQIANFYHHKGGLVKVPVLASEQVLRNQKNMLIMADMVFIGSLGFIGLFFLFLFLFFWRKDVSILYFALFCLSWSYRSLSDGYAPFSFLMPSVNWVVWSKLEYITLFLGSAMGSLFLDKIFTKHTHRWYVPIIKYITLAFVIATLLLPSQYVTQLPILFFLLIAVNILYILYVVVNSAMQHQRESLLALVSILLCTVVLMSHVFLFFGDDDVNLLYINLGYVVVFMLLSLLLAMRFSHSFSSLERLQAKTLDQKQEIMNQAHQLSEVNDQLNGNSTQLREANLLMLSMNKELEEKVLLRTARLEAINEELDIFLYRSSHDLSRPIKTIKGLIYLSERSSCEAEFRELFKRTKETVTDMELLLNKLREVHEVQSHQLTLQNVDMGEFFSALKQRIKATFKKSDHLNFNLQYPKTMCADAWMLHHIFFQLFSNSAVWLDHGMDEVTIDCAIDDSDRSSIKIKVSDNGPGIATGLEGSVFEMYKVVNTQTKSHGLGLYIVRKIIEKCNGKITLHNKQCHGVEVLISIPRKPVEKSIPVHY
ncbi:MAG: sensor histidine kinase [Cyclobacteriaceae bacterium]